ncbi:MULTISPECIES: aldehyde dehydrogenase family protein [Lysinibacillus]|uniref:aldehyde dehydrogenase family protein n=1 Tax=Lysinibacillus TaxID=400634 RepID=UPI0028BE1B08|nr:aldehyde dehydrogenase family protein [Lysinibacillus capsici]MED4552954.1 aldehyde dehydrogenase family protein [Lysinibacillus capsici]WNN77524.1 aldehyde dehydrogenase family protein [Lysinibacillus capsici]
MIKQNYLNGQWVTSDSKETLYNVNPSNIKEVLGEYQNSNEADVNAAFNFANEAKKKWRRLSYLQRAEYLYKTAQILLEKADEIAALLSKEVGKTIDESKGEVIRGVNILRYFAGEGYRAIGENIPPSDADGTMYTMREPLGVVGIISPWNFPCAIPLWKTAPALIFGNTVVLKPAKEASLTAIKIVECFDEAGLPEGVLNLVTGEGRVIGDLILNNQHLNAISFTGSNGVGKHIGKICNERGIKCQLEMGGKNPIVVSEKANLELAVTGILNGAFKFTGQKCTACSRVYVQSSIYEKVKSSILTKIKNINVGDAINPNSWMGPSSNLNQYETVKKYVTEAISNGNTLLVGGNFEDTKGYFSEPTIFEIYNNKEKIVQEEIFGPVLALMKFENLNDAIELCNDSIYGLSASLYSENINEILMFIRDIECGMVRINSETSGVELQAPFGGMKESSSHSREQGRAAVEFYTSIKTVFVK